MHFAIDGGQSCLFDGLTAAQHFSVVLTGASWLVDQQPRRETAVLRQVLVEQVFFTTEVGRQRQGTAPFVAVGMSLGIVFLGGGDDEVELRGVLIRKGGHGGLELEMRQGASRTVSMRISKKSRKPYRIY